MLSDRRRGAYVSESTEFVPHVPVDLQLDARPKPALFARHASAIVVHHITRDYSSVISEIFVMDGESWKGIQLRQVVTTWDRASTLTLHTAFSQATPPGDPVQMLVARA